MEMVGGGYLQEEKDLVSGLTATEKKVGGGIHLQRKNVRKPDGSWGYANWRNVGGEIQKKIVEWDVAPGEDYFKELFRVSRNQIVWGANYFRMPPSRNFVIWDKITISENFSMASCEYAWVSINGNAKIFRMSPGGQPDRFHPTQKPIQLYTWLLNRFAKEGDKILDTHVGSASSLIACYRKGLEYWGFEIDKEYFDKATERIEKEKNQIRFELD